MDEAGVIAAAIASGPTVRSLAERVLGPTADYIGEAIPRLPAKARANVKAVLNKALRKAGDAPNDEQVPARVLKAVWDDAVVADDELRQDYLAGVLVSARTKDGRDDRAAAQASMVADLSTYALRTHYLLYAALQRLSVGKDASYLSEGEIVGRFFVPEDDYAAGMAFAQCEREDLEEVLFDSLRSLARFDLANPSFFMGPPEYLSGEVPHSFPTSGFVWTPSQGGAYFLGAVTGVRQRVAEAWVESSERFTLECGPCLPRVVPLDDLPPAKPSRMAKPTVGERG